MNVTTGDKAHASVNGIYPLIAWKRGAPDHTYVAYWIIFFGVCFGRGRLDVYDGGRCE